MKFMMTHYAKDNDALLMIRFNAEDMEEAFQHAGEMPIDDDTIKIVIEEVLVERKKQ